MVIKTNVANGKESLDDLIKPEDLTNVNPKEYFWHPKLEEDINDLRTSIEESKDFGTEMGSRNFLFRGSPGTGKTLGAMVLSRELEIPFYDITPLVKGQSQFIPQVFEALRRIAAENEKGVIAFIDEIDGLSGRDNIVDPMQLQAFTQLLSEIDGTKNNSGVFLIGSTNRQNDLDEAMRARFSEEIEFLPPDKDGRLAILNIHAKQKGGHKFEVDDVDIKAIADKTYGYVGRDLKQLLTKSFIHAKRNGRTKVDIEDLQYGLKKVKPSAIRDMPFIEPSVKLDDVVGYDDHKVLLRKIVERSDGTTILMYGIKGTGKTYSAEALAGEFGFNFILIKGSELETKWVGETKDRVERLVKRATQLRPCIICFDEISSFVERKGVLSHKDSQTGYLQSLLSRPPEGVYIIGTDNNPEFLRGPFMDRFVHKIFYGLPSREDQIKLWQSYAEGISSEDIERIVEARDDLTCRDIAQACERINDYGANMTANVVLRIVKGIPVVDNKKQYDTIVDEIGDSVRDFRLINNVTGGKE